MSSIFDMYIEEGFIKDKINNYKRGKKIDLVKKLYNELNNVIDGKDPMRSPDINIFALAKRLGISSTKIEAGQLKCKFNAVKGESLTHLFFGYESYNAMPDKVKAECDKFAKIIPEVKTNTEIPIYDCSSYIFCYSPKAKQYYYQKVSDDILGGKTSKNVEALCNEKDNWVKDIDDDIIKEACGK